jgi:hypothetical protein
MPPGTAATHKVSSWEERGGRRGAAGKKKVAFHPRKVGLPDLHCLQKNLRRMQRKAPLAGQSNHFIIH